MAAAGLIVTTDQYDLHGQQSVQQLFCRHCVVLQLLLVITLEELLMNSVYSLYCQVIRTCCAAGRYTEGSNKEAVTAHHDFLMLACKLDDVPWLDTQPDEADIFKSIHNYELTTTCVSIPASAANDIPTTPHMFLPEKLTSVQFLNRCAV